jgi:hypothetical protein
MDGSDKRTKRRLSLADTGEDLNRHHYGGKQENIRARSRGTRRKPKIHDPQSAYKPIPFGMAPHHAERINIRKINSSTGREKI